MLDVAGRLTERQLVHGAQMLKVASEIGKVGLWDWNVETGELTWSDEHFRMEGYEPGEIVPTYEIWADRVYPDDRSATEAKIKEAIAEGKYPIDLEKITDSLFENYLELKHELQREGHTFVTETDTEVVAHLVNLAWNGLQNLEPKPRAVSIRKS